MLSYICEMKQQHQLLLLFTAMALSLAALLAMQWYWLREGRAARQAQFDQSVAEALRQTNYALEAMEARRLLGKAVDQSQWVQRFDSIAGSTAFYKMDTLEAEEPKAKRTINPSNVFVFDADPAPTAPLFPPALFSSPAIAFDAPKNGEETLRKIDSLFALPDLRPQISISRLHASIERKTDSIIQVLIKQDSMLVLGSEKTNDTRIYLRSELRTKNGLQTTTVASRAPKVYKRKSKTVVQRKVPIDSLLAQVTVDFIRPKLPIEQRIKEAQFDSILQQSLLSKGISLPYQYWVTRAQGDSATFIFGNQKTPPNKSHLYQTQLFPNDLFHLNEQLILYFVNESSYLSQGLRAMYVLSALLFFLIGGIFFAAMRYLMHQKRLSDMKSDFINNMSHEFKTPLATINLATDALGNEKVRTQPDQVNKYLSIIKSENKRMNQHVELVLQTARLERKQLKLNCDFIDLASVVVQAASLMEMQFENKGGKITCNQFPQITIYADETHLLNVFTNLLDNAQKYCVNSPMVEINLQVLPNRCLLIVSDNGIGMSREEKDHVFDQFYRIPTGNLHNVKGFGLGLSYAKAIVEAHGGNIQVNSEPGKGSTFTIQLPLNQAQ